MNRSLLLITLLAATGLAACNKPDVVAVPVATPAPVAGPAGPAGPVGNTGDTGATGRTGGNTTVVVVQPAASAPAN
jgi:hypothetical protein